MVKSVLGLGSNIGERETQLKRSYKDFKSF